MGHKYSRRYFRPLPRKPEDSIRQAKLAFIYKYALQKNQKDRIAEVSRYYLQLWPDDPLTDKQAEGLIRRAHKLYVTINRPAVTPRLKSYRLRWCQTALRWMVGRIDKIWYSDEKYFVFDGRAGGGGKVLAFSATDYQRYQEHAGKEAVAWMVTGVVSVRDGPIHFKVYPVGSRIDAATYRADTLEVVRALMASLPAGETRYWMEDNARPHTAAESEAVASGLRTLVHPPRSPELNLIEYVWSDMQMWLQNTWQATTKDSFLRGVVCAWKIFTDPERLRNHLDLTLMRNMMSIVDAKGGVNFVERTWRPRYDI